MEQSSSAFTPGRASVQSITKMHTISHLSASEEEEEEGEGEEGQHIQEAWSVHKQDMQNGEVCGDGRISSSAIGESDGYDDDYDSEMERMLYSPFDGANAGITTKSSKQLQTQEDHSVCTNGELASPIKQELPFKSEASNLEADLDDADNEP
ncbi:uncharacterized protein MONOS_8951 [Monocercomonoides exilis]|uniref:uncharacterized protein n=1 Tax=Monocercomonoides exilis TaxID=2049356 RepID=UPI00355A40E7|nr:hypothetical protein MONOS_8951 [Monocercomonoides exilis]|eukprot:MONOS_8951.1-p1 / transcript=MONOS_8951.1 / gene=MONOS_8951 / organism=Monocercomonoides_exilis_PA203 / gene_product=unspecified product / transcript_product=unspecified product / location=Mono_scaffold00353:7438-7893(-) / protein_length=152 / sequence_SO=supercontig / SO=protein_coding / is_pseudo=false